MALMLVIGGVVAVHSLQVVGETSSSLAEERLERLQAAQRLLQRTLLIEHQSRLLVTGTEPEDVEESYARSLTLLDALDRQVARFARTDSSAAILDLHQASQLFRNTVHVIARLRTDALTRPHVTGAQDAERQRTLGRFQRELERQADAIGEAAEEISETTADGYRKAAVDLSTTTRHRQQLVLATLIAGLLLAWLVSRYFRKHALSRLQQVSRRLRLGTDDGGSTAVSTRGDDEIDEMARAVDRFLDDHRRLATTESELREHEAMLQAITDAAQSAVVLIDDEDVIRFANPAAERLFGYEHGELEGHKAHDTLVPGALQGRAKAGFSQFARSGTGPVLEKPQELIARRKDGSEVFIELYIGRLHRGGRWWAVGAAIDISSRKHRERMLTNQAETDPLTGVRNRRSFLQLAGDALERSRVEGTQLFFLMLDLDHFKAINDDHGHAAGDQVLREFAAVCARSLRDTDLFGRIGGEEFAAVLTGKDMQTVVSIAERIRTAFVGTMVQVGNKRLEVDTSVSIGLVRGDPERDSVESGLQRADAALYRAKAGGRNRTIAG
jgi:diguanylate cyclase (GGDEF)-like protein/PAS domain S-box-containing protein